MQCAVYNGVLLRNELVINQTQIRIYRVHDVRLNEQCRLPGCRLRTIRVRVTVMYVKVITSEDSRVLNSLFSFVSVSSRFSIQYPEWTQ